MYGYIYKTTNLINNKIYIGQKKNTKFLAENYLGSGDLIKKAIKKYGKENFHVILLDTAENKKELDIKEKLYIKLYNSQNKDIGYNISNGGQGGNLGDEISAKISQKLLNHKTSDDTKAKISVSLKGRKLSEEIKQKISKSNTGKKCSPETTEKMKSAALNRNNSNIGRFNKNKICITDGFIIKFIDINDPIPEGFKVGNCKTSCPHDMSNYYNSQELIQHRKLISSGCNNNMYGKGYKISGGKNGKAIYNYYFNDLLFDCRKSLIEFLQQNGYPNISVNDIRNIQNNKITNKLKNNYLYIINNLRWELKDENKKY